MSAPKATKFAPCPICGETPYLFKKREVWTAYYGSVSKTQTISTDWSVSCINDQRIGWTRKPRTKQQAIADWNRVAKTHKDRSDA